jgi:hemerythrin-like domain-containing protein
MKSKCIGLLISEHKVILRSVEVLRTMARHATDTQQLNKQDVHGLLEVIRLYADDLHQGKEEGALFPVFTAKCDPREVDAIRHMLFEHEEDRALMEGIEDAVQRSHADDFADNALRLVEILRTHIYKEDNILFEMIDQQLSDEDDARILTEFEAFDREFDKRGSDRIRHRLRMLEWKYLSRPAA